MNMFPTVLLTLLLLTHPAPRRQAADPIVQIVLHLEAERRAAHLAQDADRLGAILADDFVDVAVTGVRRTKQQNVDETRRGVIRWTTLVARNEQVTVFDSTAAVVTGEQEGSGTYDGQPFSRRVRYMRVYLKRRGRWQNIAAQNSLIAP
jgi:ketosteroid isomerase-like protein